MSVQGWTKTNRAGIYRKEVETGEKFRIRISVLKPDGERHREQKTLPSNTSLEEAAKIRSDRIAQLKEASDDGPGHTTIASFMRDWLARKSRRWSASYAAKNRKLLAKKVLPHFGHLHVDEIRMAHIVDWIDWAESQRLEDDDGDKVPYAQATLHGWWKLVRNMVKALWRAGHVSRDFRERVAGRDGIDGPTSPGSGVRCTNAMTAEELSEFLDAAEKYVPRRYPELVTLAYTGMRAGELYALKWDYIDREREVIWIRRAVWGGEEKPPKTDETKRAPLAPVVDDAIQSHRERLIAEQHPGLETGLVFPSDVGSYRYSSSLGNPMRKVCEYIDLGWTATPQNLRRTFVNLMRRAGVDTVTRRSIVGHRDEESEEPYLHVPIGDQHAAVDQMITVLEQGGERAANRR